MSITVRTNHHERDVVYDFELSPTEREEFDYLDWPAIERGEDSASFFRYLGSLYDLGEFTPDYGIFAGGGLPEHLANWHGYLAESAFSAVVVRYTDDHEHVVVGRVLS